MKNKLGCFFVIGLAFFCQLSIIFGVTYPPLIDLPNHMARHVLEYNWLHSTLSSPFYEIHYQILPNLGGDIIVPVLLMFLMPLTAVKVFLVFCNLMFWFGGSFYILQSNHYRSSALIASLLLLPFVFNSSFFFGFLNYYSGLGLAFLVLVHFKHMWYRSHFVFTDLIFHTLLVCILFLWHLSAWGIYGLIMFCHILVDSFDRYRQQKNLSLILARAFTALLPALISLGLLCFYLFSQSIVDTENIEWGGVLRKITLPLRQFGIYNIAMGISFIFLWASAIVCFFGFRWRLVKYQINFLSICVLALASILIPDQISNESSSDLRVWPAIVICALAIIGSMSASRIRLGLVLLTLCLLTRYASIYLAWKALDERLKSAAISFNVFEPYSRVLPIILSPTAKEFPEKHFLGWAVISKNIYMPTLFANHEQPLKLKLNCPILLMKTNNAWTIEDAKVRACYDYVWVYNPKFEQLILPLSYEQVYKTIDLSVYRVH